MFCQRLPLCTRITVLAATLGLSAALLVSSCGETAGSPSTVSFKRDIQPIFNQSCTSCHPASYPYLDLRPGHAYSQLVGVSAATAPSYERVLPNRPNLSYLLVGPEDPSRTSLLTARQRRLLARWILQGAKNN